MTDLTILIPSIGRKTILESIESVDVDSQIHVLTSGLISPEVRHELITNDRIQYEHLDNRLSAGKAKQHLIDGVSTKYFMILDDDDKLTPGFLRSALSTIDSEHHWVLTGFDKNPHPHDYTILEINSMESLYNVMFEYDKYNEDYVKTHLYPNSSCIIETEIFKKLKEPFKLSYGDDVIPILTLLINFKGYYCCTGCITQNSARSVSRNLVTYGMIDSLITELTIRSINSKSQLESKIWNRAYSNLLLRINHMNKNYK